MEIVYHPFENILHVHAIFLNYMFDEFSYDGDEQYKQSYWLLFFE